MFHRARRDQCLELLFVLSLVGCVIGTGCEPTWPLGRCAFQLAISHRSAIGLANGKPSNHSQPPTSLRPPLHPDPHPHFRPTLTRARPCGTRRRIPPNLSYQVQHNLMIHHYAHDRPQQSHPQFHVSKVLSSTGTRMRQRHRQEPSR